MSGRGTVSLLRVPPQCPTCGAPRSVETGPLGTQVRASCDPYNCRLARIIRLAGRWLDRSEVLPLDDSRAPRRFGRGAA